MLSGPTIALLLICMIGVASRHHAHHVHRHTATTTPAPATEPELTLGPEVVDVVGVLVAISGNISCFISHTKNGERLPEPLKSRPIYKYCKYSVEGGTGGAQSYSSGYDDYHPVYENFFDTLLKTKNVSMVREKLYVSGRDKPPQTSLNFVCKNEMCNVPLKFMDFLDFNHKKTPAERKQIIEKLLKTHSEKKQTIE